MNAGGVGRGGESNGSVTGGNGAPGGQDDSSPVMHCGTSPGSSIQGMPGGSDTSPSIGDSCGPGGLPGDGGSVSGVGPGGGGVPVSLNGSGPKTSGSNSATSTGGAPVPLPVGGVAPAQGSGVAGFGFPRAALPLNFGLNEAAPLLPVLATGLALALLVQPAPVVCGTVARLPARTFEKCACCDHNALLWVIRAAFEAAGKAIAAASRVGASSLIGRMGRSSG